VVKDRGQQNIAATLSPPSQLFSDVSRFFQRINAFESLSFCAARELRQPPLSDRYGAGSVSSGEYGIHNNISSPKSSILPDVIRKS
jgi:hypothetical protein